MNKEEFISAVKNLGIDLNQEQYLKFDKYAKHLIAVNQITNLTSIKDYNQVFLKHFYDSLCLIKALNSDQITSLLDIGSGAGFPGIVIKIIFPELKVTLLEPNGKKASFLREVSSLLQLSDLEVVNKRAEDYCSEKREAFDFVTARAVAPLNILAELSIPFVKVGGYFVAMKGKNEEDFEQGKFAIKELGGLVEEKIEYILPFEESQRMLIKVHKKKVTNKIYPRRYDKIIKNSLKK